MGCGSSRPGPTISAGDSMVLQVTVQGEGVDLTGATVRWQLATSPAGPPLVSKTTAEGIHVTGPASFEVNLDPADTAALSGLFYQEAEVVDGYGRRSTVLSGDLWIAPTLIS